MAATLSQAIDMFKSIDVDNTGLISREELKTLMQEIGGDMWAGDNFGTMLETCGVKPEDKDVNYSTLLKQLLGDEEPKVEAPQEAPASAAEVKKEEAKAEEIKPQEATNKAPTEQDIADSAALVEMVCNRILGTMKTEAVVDAKSEEPTSVAKLEEAKLDEVKPEEAKPKEANPEEPKSEECKPKEADPEMAKSEEAKPDAANAQDAAPALAV